MKNRNPTNDNEMKTVVRKIIGIVCASIVAGTFLYLLYLAPQAAMPVLAVIVLVGMFWGLSKD